MSQENNKTLEDLAQPEDVLKDLEEVEAGVHTYSAVEDYVVPTEPKVLEKLEWFKDQKLALMMHWGPYSQIGVVESWALSDQDADWARNDIDWETNDETFKQQYKDLNKTFNPIRFQPDEWAKIAAEGGFKYLIFTTKHHDGFCMWDTKYSDYKITSKDCPFHTHQYADICRHLFEAMRRKGLGIAAYFSKADWHIPNYWTPNTERGSFMWRGPSYNPQENPELWEEFVQFTHNQLLELATEYGRIETMWFDAGWVCERSGQDIRLGEVMDKVRRVQPWVISADRTVGGAYENYITPEQCIPNDPIDVPWESCITMGTSFSFKYEDEYKSVRELVRMLVEVVCKGGNLALNVGPQPDGRLPQGAVKRMKGLGQWLKVNGEAIYATRVCAPYVQDDIFFTQKAKEKTVYAFKLYDAKTSPMADKLFLPIDIKVKEITLLETQENLSYEYVQGGIEVYIDRNTSNAPIADVIKIIKL